MSAAFVRVFMRQLTIGGKASAWRWVTTRSTRSSSSRVWL